MLFPTNIATGRVTGQFLAGIVDGADDDQEPDAVPASGSVTFTASVPYLPGPTATPNPATILTTSIVAVLDREGYLCTPVEGSRAPDYRGVRLIATEATDISVIGWTWNATYSFNPVAGQNIAIPDHSFSLPSGGTVDLTTVVKVPSSTGIGTEQAEALAASAQAAALQSALDASAAAASAAEAAGAAQVTDDNIAALVSNPDTATGLEVAALIDEANAGKLDSTDLDSTNASLVGNITSAWWLALLALLKTIFLSRGELSVNVKDYGAKGDGTTDDTSAITDAAAAARDMGIPLAFEPNKNYYLASPVPIPIYTSVNFNNSKITSNESAGPDQALFTIMSTKSTLSLSSIQQAAIGPIDAKTRRIPALSGYGMRLVQLENSAIQANARSGSSTMQSRNLFTSFIVDDRGYLLTSNSIAMSNFTSAKLIPVDETTIVIENLHIHSTDLVDGSGYTFRNIQTSRSNVIHRNITHTVDDGAGKRANAGMFSANDCANLLYENIRGHTSKSGTNGSYDLAFTKVIGLTLSNVRGQDFEPDAAVTWGVFASYTCKDVLVTNCQLSRVDAHRGIENLTVKDSTIGGKGITVTGKGKLHLENLIVHSSALVSLRGDYGGSWEGPIEIRDITHFVRPNQPYPVIITTTFYHNFPYLVDYSGLGKGRVSIENYTFDLMGGTAIIPLIRLDILKDTGPFAVPGQEFRYTVPKEFRAQNIKVTNASDKYSGVYFIDADAPLTNQFLAGEISATYDQADYLDTNIVPTNVKVILDGVDFNRWNSPGGNASTSQASSLFSGAGNMGAVDYAAGRWRAQWNFSIKNSRHVFAHTYDLQAAVSIDSCTVAHVACASGVDRASVRVVNSTIAPIVGGNGQVLFNLNPERMFFTNCLFAKAVKQSNFIDSGVSILEIVNYYSFLSGIGSGVSSANIAPGAYMSACKLSSELNLASVRSNIADTDFVFGNWTPSKLFTLRKGIAANRPGSGVSPGQTYTATDTGAISMWTGTTWKVLA